MSNVFGNPSGGGFGSSNTTSAPASSNFFGSGGNVLGQSSQPQTTANIFGQPNPSVPLGQGGLFGNSSQPAPGASIFGQPAQSGPLFGASSQPAQASIFGRPAQSAPLFGATPTTQGGLLFGGTSQPGQASSIFGQPAQPAQPGSIFGQPAQPAQGASIFGQPAQPAQPASVFGQPAQPAQPASIFGQPAQPAQGGSLFGQPAQGGSVFGQPAQPAQGGGLFGQLAQPAQGGNIFGQPNASVQSGQGGLFGNTPQPAPGANIFGPPAQSAPLFGGTLRPQQGGSIFGQPAQQAQGGTSINPSQPQQAGGLFGGNNQAQAPSLFGNPQQQGQQQQSQANADLIGPSRQNRIWLEQALVPDYKTVPEQIDLIFRKWNPDSADSVGFQTYLYNTVSSDAAPFYRPGPQDNEEQWEAAFRKRPNQTAVPFMLRGFYQLGQRILIQEECLRVLHGRLYEINAGLTALLTKHDVDISTRTAQCRRKHIALSQKCLALATKTQLLRNRGYAMDGPEEDLRQKLLTLEKQVFDPALEGRGEEIWARMVSLRERGRALQHEMERRGLGGLNANEQSLDEETLEKARKILADYHTQLEHLTKELERLQVEWTVWVPGRPTVDGNANTRSGGNGASGNGAASSQAGGSGPSSNQSRRGW